MSRKSTPWQVRLFSRSIPNADGCLIWQGFINRHGYGTFTGLDERGNKRLSTAHRWAYIATRGPVDDGLQVDHLCFVRSCINPEHLEAVTPAENLRRRRMPSLTHCKRGHEFTPENTRTTASGHRQCITCKRAYETAQYYAGKRKRYRKRAAEERAA